MKSKLTFALSFLMGVVLGLVLLAGDARAQQPAARDSPPAWRIPRSQPTNRIKPGLIR